MNKVDWSKIPPEYRWVTTDVAGVIQWKSEPVWDEEEKTYRLPPEIYGYDTWDYVSGTRNKRFLPRTIQKRPTEGDKP